MNEHEISDLMQRAGGRLAPDVDHLVAGGTARGRRLRARRRTALGAGGVAALGVAGLVATVALGGAGASGTGTDVAASPTAPASTPAAPPTSGPADVRPERFVAMDPAKTAWVLGTLLDGPTSGREVWHEGPHPLGPGREGFQGGRVLWRGTRVQVLIERAPDDRPVRERCTDERAPGVCEPVGDDGRDWIRSWRETAQDAPAGVVGNHVDLYTGDGFHLSVSAYHDPDQRGSTTERRGPLLSLEELAAIATDPVWFVERQ